MNLYKVVKVGRPVSYIWIAMNHHLGDTEWKFYWLMMHTQKSRIKTAASSKTNEAKILHSVECKSSVSISIVLLCFSFLSEDGFIWTAGQLLSLNLSKINSVYLILVFMWVIMTKRVNLYAPRPHPVSRRNLLHIPITPKFKKNKIRTLEITPQSRGLPEKIRGL